MFYYYGRKYSNSKKYPAPLHRTVVEPFGGAAGYSCWHAEHGNIDHAIVYDLDPRVVELWLQLQTCNPDDLPQNIPIGEKTTEPFVMFQANSSGDSFRPHLKIGKMTGPVRQKRVVETVRRLQPFCSKFEINLGSYVDIPQNMINDPGLTWFIDPPYQQPADRTHHRSRGGGYLFGSSGIDFAALGDWCRSLAGQVIVCESEGADWLPFEHLYHLTALNGKATKEVVWLSAASST